ncbi:PAS domain-containing protein [Kitasatospora camelliae]|uniref:PAS domain-containing protein n=1 Tax=Kitasatospora camelliae TaxID=3156397 RepID=A0AAU8K4F0_9ACTN
MRQGESGDQHGPPPTEGSGPTEGDGTVVGDGRPLWRSAVERDLADTLLRTVRGASAYGGVLYLRSADRRSLVVSAVVGVPLHLISGFRRIPVAAPLPPAEAYRTGRTILLGDADETMRRYPRLAVGLPYVYATGYTPLIAGDRTFGALAVLWPYDAGGPPTTARRQLRSAANRMAAALAPYGDEVAAEGDPAVVPLPLADGFGSRVGLFEWDLDGGRLTVDDELREILGLDDAFDGRAATLTERLAPEDVPLLHDAARRAAYQGEPFARQVRVRDARGGYRTVELRGRALAGSATLVVAVLDTSAHTAAAAAVERLRDGVFALDADGRVTYVNRSAELLLEAGRAQLLARHPWDVLPWLADPAYEDRYRAAMLSQQPTAFLACRPPDGWLAFSLYPDAHGLTGRIIPAGEPGGHHRTLPEARPPPPPASAPPTTCSSSPAPSPRRSPSARSATA